MRSTLRCDNCNHWLGESSTELVFVETVAKGAATSIPPPRDLRVCKSCNRVNVFLARSDLDGALASTVR